nr:MAG TPA: hypothetical protein [Caudoviricetes sp.]
MFVNAFIYFSYTLLSDYQVLYYLSTLLYYTILYFVCQCFYLFFLYTAFRLSSAFKLLHMSSTALQ